MPWREAVDEIRWLTRHDLPELIRPRRLPQGGRAFTVVRRLGTAVGMWAWKGRGKDRSSQPGRPVPPAAHRRRAPRPDLHQARPDHLLRRGPLPRGAGRGVQEVPRPGAGRALQRGAGHRRERARPVARGRLLVVRPPPARRRLDRPGPRRHAAHRRARRGEGAAHHRSPSWSTRTSASWRGWRPFLVGRLPVRRAGQPAGAGRAVRRDHHRGARLPPRGPEHARRGQELRRPRPARLHHPEAPPHPRHPPGAGDGAPRRLQLRRRGLDEATPASTPTRSCAPA